MPVLDSLGNGEGELVDAISRSSFAGDGHRKIALGLSRAAAKHGVDDFPVLGVLLFGGIGLVGQAELAGAAAVDSRVCAFSKLERKHLFGASRKGLTTSGGELNAVAGEVGTRRLERVLGKGSRDGFRGVDEHVGGGGGQEEACSQEGLGERHLRCRVCVVVWFVQLFSFRLFCGLILCGGLVCELEVWKRKLY